MKERSCIKVTTQNTLQTLDQRWFREAHVSFEAQQHLLRSMRALERGSDPVPTFPLYGSYDANRIIRRFLATLEKYKSVLPEGWLDYEYDRLSKVGPQGGTKPWEEDAAQLFLLYQSRLVTGKVDEETLDEFLASYGFIHPKMLGIDLTLANLVADNKIQTRAAGCRDFNLKKTDKLAQRRALADIRSRLYLYFRMYTFLRYYKLKTRIFFPGPFANMIEQAAYIQPFIKALQENILSLREDSPLVQHADKVGFDACFDIMSSEINRCLDKLPQGQQYTLIYVQGDFEKMDTTTGPSQYINYFIPSLASSFRFVGQSMEKMRDSMLKTVNMSIISPSGVMVGDHGTGSGMENTNIGEGTCNDYYQRRTIKILKILCRKRGIKFYVASRRVNGDDSGYVFVLLSKNPDIVELFKTLIQEAAEQAADECGFRINEKWRIDEHFGLFCQNGYYYDPKLKKVIYMYPATLILNSIMHPQTEYAKKDWDNDFVDLRITEILDNGRNLPYFKALVKYVDSGMKYGLFRHDSKMKDRILAKYARYRALQPLNERFNRQEYSIKLSPTVRVMEAKLNV